MTKKPTCFVIMPISDQEGYQKGHFARVYNYLIKPACESAGFEAIRADDETKANYIVIDIIKKIIDSDMVVCDLSGKNPNVLYELGVRQAFNKKVVLIKDIKTTRIFDIQGLRTIEYGHDLRIDEVNENITQISTAIKTTSDSSSREINSLIQLLAIEPAMPPQQFEISQESSIIMDLLGDINNRLTRIEDKPFKNKDPIPSPPVRTKKQKLKIGDYYFDYGSEVYTEDGLLGNLIDVHGDSIYLKNNEKLFRLKKSDPRYDKILPF